MCFFRPGADGIELAIKNSQRVRGSALPKFSNSRFTRSVFAGLLVAGLAVVAGPAAAAQAAPLAGHSIATAGTLSLGKSNSGGGGAIDYWKITLIGGDQLQLQTSTPDNPCCEGNYDFNLFPPGTTDTNFPQVSPVGNVFIGSGTTEQTIVLQAPYNGTFILAVCQNISGDCRDVDNGGGAQTMAAYTFTPSLVGGGIKASVGAKETKASPTIAKAPAMPIGNFESGGGEPIDFWKVTLIGGDQLQLQANLPYNPCCEGNYDFNLYPPGTNDTNFTQENPVGNVVVGSGTSKQTV